MLTKWHYSITIARVTFPKSTRPPTPQTNVSLSIWKNHFRRLRLAEIQRTWSELVLSR